MAKASVHCPKCASKFSVSRETAGRRAKCPKCDERFVIEFDDALPTQLFEIETPFRRPPPASPVARAPADQAIGTASSAEAPGDTSRQQRRRRWAIVAFTAMASLGLGYFAGREHLKYQLRNALADLDNAAAETIPSGTERRPRAEDGTSVVNVAASTPAPEAPPPPELPPRLMIGQSHAADGFSISLVDARIEKPQVMDILGDVRVGPDASLVLQFDIVNSDDRRILHFRERDLFGPAPFQLRDDVDNVIRGVSYGLGTQPIGALTSYDDIAPGATASHIELFAVPPPKTEYLIVTIDLECFGDDAEIEFQIPADRIKR